MMHKKKTVRLALILLLCAAFLTGGPIAPLTAYANLNFDGLTEGQPDVVDEGAAEEASQQEPKQQEKPAVEVKPADPTAKYQTKIDDINEKLKELQNEKKAIEASISNAKTAKEKELANKNYLDQQIAVTKNEITLMLERIALLEEDIAVKEQEIADKQDDIDESYAQFKKRLRALHVSDDATTLGLILGASDFADFLSKTETVTRIAEHDRELMRRLTVQRGELEDAKTELEEARELVIAEKEETEQRKQTLNVQLNAAAVAVYNYEQMEKDFLNELEKNKAEAKAMENELANIYRQIEWDKNPYIGGEMTWPVPGFYKISSPYGPRFGGSDFHTGMDIHGTGIYGNKVVAANAGTVKFVNWSYTPGRGYGIYLIIDHGGGTSTLYAHLSNIAVSVNDTVQKGQVVGAVGSTGWSTGPHLHFEVRLNSAHTNPYPYVVGK